MVRGPISQNTQSSLTLSLLTDFVHTLCTYRVIVYGTYLSKIISPIIAVDTLIQLACSPSMRSQLVSGKKQNQLEPDFAPKAPSLPA